MNKIVQLTEHEYNELRKQASYNQNKIEKRALEMYQENGTFEISLRIDFDDRDYSEKVKFRVWSYIDDKGDLCKFQIPYKDRKRIIKFADIRVYDFMERRFGQQIKYINIYKDQLRHLRNWKKKFIGLTIFGWLAAIALCLIAIIK